MYTEITRDIRIDVEPAFVPERSQPAEGYYFFSYKIRISNEGNEPAQLLARHWIITDGNGEVHEVEGPGVVGEQPNLAPGEHFEYSSFCPLPTPTGNMRGNYHLVSATGKKFSVRIPLFFLRDLSKVH